MVPNVYRFPALIAHKKSKACQGAQQYLLRTILLQYRADIQILRGIAVLLVVLFHFGFTYFKSGFLGVDIFFVVSGFLMATLYKKGQAISFYKRRMKRLLPAYYSTIIVTILVAALVTVPSDFKQVREQGYFALTFSSNIGFWLHNSYFSKAEFNPLLHLWSLGVEIQFYLFIPLVALVFRRSKVLFIGCLFASLAACFLIITISPKTSFFMMPLRAWEFLLGYWIGLSNSTLFPTKGKTHSVFQWGALIALALIPLLPVNGQSLSMAQGHPATFALFICLVTVIVLKNGLPAAVTGSYIGRALEKLGDYSYSVYLVHFPVIVLSNYNPFEGTTLGILSLSSGLTQIMIILFAAFINYRFIEKYPYKKPIKLSLLFTASVLVIITLSASIQTNRFSNEQQKIFFAWDNRAGYRCGKIFRFTNPTDRICSLIDRKDTEEKTPLLFVGNSHADSIKISFAKVARESNYETFFYVSNTPLMTGSTVKAKQILADAKKIGAEHVFLHYSPNALEIEQLKELQEVASKEQIKLSLILPVPVYSYHIPKALYDASQKNTKLTQQHYDDYLKHNKAERSALKKIEGLKTFEVVDLFCTPICRIKNEDGNLLYFDEGHLTLSGAEILESRLAEIFNTLR